ncbi:MAG: head maturation protease, ClpP-related [Fusobacteriaceae bacterium]
MKWWEIINKGKTGEIKVFGDIARHTWIESDCSAKSFTDQLENLKGCEEITLRINSNGGSVYESVAMFNSFRRFTKDNNIKTTTYIEGMAASAASYLALASSKVYMGVGCKFMIHNPATYSGGTSNDFRKVAEQLDAVKEDIIDIYMEKTKLTREEISAYMDEEKYFSTKEAIETGFVDEEIALSEKDLKNNIKNMFSNEIVNKLFPEINKTNMEEEMTGLEIKNKYPDVINELREELKKELENEMQNINTGTQNKIVKLSEEEINNALNDDRERIRKLENLKPINKKQIEIINKAKYEEPRTAEELIVQFYNDGSLAANEVINQGKKEAEEVGINNITDNIGTNVTNIDDAIEKAFEKTSN